MTVSRKPLSTERVLQAALSLADKGGTDTLTMRAIGQALGVEAMSLYKHVANKDAILDGIVDLVVAEIALPDPADAWKTAMRRRGVSAHEVLLRHKWACALLMARPNVGPAMLRYVESTLETLRGAGFSVKQADYAWNAMDSHIYGFTLQRVNSPFEADQYAEAAETYVPRLPPGEFPRLTELAEHVMDGRYDGVPPITFGLDLILDGLERTIT
ncbi:TetR/AcrR family transcriptional regulator C-terminal domain-containing protein [Actinokineospora sp. HUAS TT18]|uniref:TetR/AcrR family transcriptional regulator C-terminal domain-containing protein n=1 Tax=Actinokineospora sp. HUAS TT18 TaxID=3447451 RepID=UPI003F5224EC